MTTEPPATEPPSTEPLYTQNWANVLRKNQHNFLDPLIKGMPSINYLEIGVFEALGAVHMLSKYPQLKYTGIDCWNLADAPVVIEDKDGIDAVHMRAEANIKPFSDRARLIKNHSVKALCQLVVEFEDQRGFDLIYIDAGHFATDVVIESALCWNMLKVGGIMFWDDYKNQGVRNTVKTGADAFLGCVAGRYETLFTNHQLGIRKMAEAQDQTEYRVRKGKALQ